MQAFPIKINQNVLLTEKIPSTDFLLQNICKTCNNEKSTVLD